MAEMLSPGVFTQEIDASTIVPTVSNSIAVFGGNFHQGRVGKYSLITSVAELVEFYGKPSDKNFNDFYQAYSFLQYANKLLVSRAANVNGKVTAISGVTVETDIDADTTKDIVVLNTESLKVGDWISLGDSETSDKFYEITGVVANTKITVDRNIEDGILADSAINTVEVCTNGVAEAVKVGGTDVAYSYDYIKKMVTIGNEEDFEMLENSIAFTGADSKLKFIARTPGKWAGDLKVAIANPDSFGNNTKVFDGVNLDDLFEYAPTGTEVGIVVSFKDEIKEIFTVDFNQDAKDSNNKSTYIETVINNQSNYIYVKDNTSVSTVKDYTFTAGKLVQFYNGKDSDIQADDLLNAYELFQNSEEIDKQKCRLIW